MTPYLLSQYLPSAAETEPDALAVIDRGRALTYAELEARANQLAHTLVELGVARGDRVGLYLDKSLESIVAIHAVLKVGAAYVPLDRELREVSAFDPHTRVELRYQKFRKMGNVGIVDSAE